MSGIVIGGVRAVDAAELEHAAGDPRLGVDGVGLDEPVGEERDALGEKADEHLVERRMPLRELAQLGAAHDERLRRLERGDGRAPLGLGHNGELAEGLPRPADREGDLVAVLRRNAHVEPALRDEVDRVRRVVAVEDDLAAPVRAAPGEGEDGSDVLLRDAREDAPFHMSQALHTLRVNGERRAAGALVPSRSWSNGRGGHGT